MHSYDPRSRTRPAPETPAPFHESRSIVRDRYFYGMLLQAEDMAVEQAFHLCNARRHALELHGVGTVRGLRVDASGIEEVTVCPGLALDCLGREILVEQRVTVSLRDAVSEATARIGRAPGAGIPVGAPRAGASEAHYHAVDVFISLLYAEAPDRPVQAVGGPEAACAPACDDSRVQHGFRVVASAEEPPGPSTADLFDALLAHDVTHERLQEWLCDVLVDERLAAATTRCAEEHACVTLAKVRVVAASRPVFVDNVSCRPLVVPTALIAGLLQYLAQNPGRCR